VTAARNGVRSQGLTPLKRSPAAAHDAIANAKAVNGHRRKSPQRPADLSVLHAHPAWASLSAARWLQQAQAVAETLGMFGQAAAVLSAHREMLAYNTPFEALMPDLMRECRSRLLLLDPLADRLIGDALARLDCSAHGTAARAIAIRAGGGKPVAIAHLVGIHGGGHEPSAGVCGILIVSPLKPRPAPSPQILQRLFGLSPAEARVASGIAGRQTIETIAGDFGVSRETVRSQLKIVLAKTGAKRQLDLAVLLCGLQLPKS
jgi:DNA-binding CsgD family transcriptional regulator